ncbi:hypothetical protein [Pseudoalteromonas sp. GB56]
MRFFVLLSALLAFFASAAPQQFLVFGDMPYTPVDEALLSAPDGQLYQAVQQTPHLFIAHVGDMKSGATPCTDELLQRSFTMINALTEQPFVYTPGDNDWTDCDRQTLTPTFDELERLAFVRSQFATSQLPLTNFSRQSEQPENQAWRIGDVQYVTLHVVGTNNGRAQVFSSDTQVALASTQQRDALNKLWLAKHTTPAVTQAGSATSAAKAVVVFIQADIYQHNDYGPACSEQQQTHCDGLNQYQVLFDDLAKSSNAPVLLVHGDTAEFCFSQRESGLWHLNAPGDFRILDIAQVTVDTQSDDVFALTTLLSSVPSECE